jgi:hypothetical protein
MAAIAIERLSLSVPGLSPERAERLVQMIAHGLAEANLPPAATARLATLKLNLTAEAGQEEGSLAARIVTGLMAQLCNADS